MRRDPYRRSFRMPQETRSKYGAKRTTVDGITFHSQREAARYQELLLLGKAGQLTDLELQPVFWLRVADGAKALEGDAGSITIGQYIADFRYHDRRTQRYVVEDVKGFDVPLGRWKRKHVEAQYGITVRIIK